MRGRDSVEFTGAVAIGAVAGAVLVLIWRRISSVGNATISRFPFTRG